MEMVSSVIDQCVISPSLLASIDPDAITHPNLRIGWEELLGEPINLGSEQYADLFKRPPYRVGPSGRTASGSVATVRTVIAAV